MAGDSLRRGLLANYLGKGFCALLGLISLPILYRQLGPEAFGLFGLFFTVQAVLGVFDFGVGAAMQRDLAAFNAGAGQHNATDLRATLQTIERLLLGLAVLVCTLAFLSGPYLASHWLGIQALSAGLVGQAVGWITLAAALQLTGSFYIGCLNGLQRHGQTNIIQSGVWAVRFVLLMLCVQAGVAPAGSMSLAVLTVLQAWSLTNALLVIWACVKLKRALPPASSTPGLAYLSRAARFGLPLVMTTTLIMLFNQVDKIAASRLITLDTFGRYTIVWSVAEILYLMYQPIYTSFLPVFAGRFTSLRDAQQADDLNQSIMLAWQMMTVAVLPVAVVVFAMPDGVILAWTGDVLLAQDSAAILRWVIVGAAGNAFLFIPFALQQAVGDMRPWVWRIALALLIYSPLAIAAISRWGMLGAAAAWCVGSVCLTGWLASACVWSLRQQGLNNLRVGTLLISSMKTFFMTACIASVVAIASLSVDRFGAALVVLATLAVCLMVALRSQLAVWDMVLRGFNRFFIKQAAHQAP